MVCLSLELVGPWVVLGFSIGIEAFDELISINVPWSQEFSGVLRILGLSLLPLAFGSCHSSLKTSPSTQHRRYIPRFIDETILHSQKHPERFTELYREEKMEEGDRGDQEEKRESQKGREQSSH